MTFARPGPEFWDGRRVLVTGHTGFKGAWLCLLLEYLGAEVSGFALPPEPRGAFDTSRPSVNGEIVDVRDAISVERAVRRAGPGLVPHLAAQALAGEGHARPWETFATNVMGTASLLEVCCAIPGAAVLVVTSDKVYRPDPGRPPFNENGLPGGSDPYSASKVAAARAWMAGKNQPGAGLARTAGWHQAAWRAEDMHRFGRAQIDAWMMS